MAIRSQKWAQVSILAFIGVVLIWASYPCPAAQWTLVQFGNHETNTVTPYSDWTHVLRETNYTEFVEIDGVSGIRYKATTPSWESAYYGISGVTPIQLQRGHKIIARFYHCGGSPYRLQPRISFTDSNAPPPSASPDPNAPWHTLYVENESFENKIQPGVHEDLVFNIADTDSIVAPGVLTTTGAYTVINIALYSEDAPGTAFILEEIILTDEADLTPPGVPQNLEAAPVSLSVEAGLSGIRLDWDPAVDPDGPNGPGTGVSRYYLYRDDVFMATLSRDETRFLSNNLHYIDLTVVPGQVYRYGVSAVDRATTGFYRVPNSSSRFGNESAIAETTVTAAVFRSSRLLHPSTDITYLGAFLLPVVEEVSAWTYTYTALAYYNDGDPADTHTNASEFGGSLFGIGHAYYPFISEVSIPTPVCSTNINDLPFAATLHPFTNIWPCVYTNGNWQPDGSVTLQYGLGLHNGPDGNHPFLYYGFHWSYSPAYDRAHGAFNVNLDQGYGAWWIGAPYNEPGYIDLSLTARYFANAPQSWADSNTESRSLLVGNGYVSGRGVPSRGPTLFAIAPWANLPAGQMPTNRAILAATELLRYGAETAIDRQMVHWSLAMGYAGAAWISEGLRHAVVIVVARPIGEDWYGGENGYEPLTSDFNLPPRDGTELRGPLGTRNESSLYFFNPDDLKRVAQGDLQAWEPQPYAVLNLRDYLFTKNNRYINAGAIAFDPVRGLLYYMEGDAYRPYGPPASSAVHVFRIRARDSSGDGLPDWWKNLYGFDPAVSNSSASDADGDTFSDYQEYCADTDPTNQSSCLCLTLCDRTDGFPFRIAWQGGIDAYQRLEYTLQLTNEHWESIYSNTPPTPFEQTLTNIALPDALSGFYRLRVWRP